MSILESLLAIIISIIVISDRFSQKNPEVSGTATDQSTTQAMNAGSSKSAVSFLSSLSRVLWVFGGFILVAYCLFPPAEINTRNVALMLLSAVWFLNGLIRGR